MEELDLMPLKIDRSTDLGRLDGETARLMEWIDVGWLRGRLRRAAGEAGTQIQAANQTVKSAFVAVRRDCRKIVLDSSQQASTSPNGICRATVGNASSLMCLGPTNEWHDTDDMSTRISENDDIDGDVDSGDVDDAPKPPGSCWNN